MTSNSVLNGRLEGYVFWQGPVGSVTHFDMTNGTIAVSDFDGLAFVWRNERCGSSRGAYPMGCRRRLYEGILPRPRWHCDGI